MVESMTNLVAIKTGTLVVTWDGHMGTVIYRTKTGWYGVRIVGEQRVDEWQPEQLEVVP